MYHGLTVRLNKRFSNGLTFLVSFTGAKTMDDSAAAVTYLGPVSSTREDQYNRRLEWSVSPQDISRRLVSSFVYDLPFGKKEIREPRAARRESSDLGLAGQRHHQPGRRGRRWF
jgi:hypothetical protein